MSGILIGIAYLAAVNPFRARVGVPEGDDLRARPGVLAAGALLALAGVWALAGWSGPFLEALQVTPETFRLAAGIVITVVAMVLLARPRPHDEPEAPGALAALWPVAYPRLLTVAVVALALTTGSYDGAVPSVVAAAVALVIAVALGFLRRTPLADRVLVGVGRLLAVLLAIVAVFLMVEGIRDV